MKKRIPLLSIILSFCLIIEAQVQFAGDEKVDQQVLETIEQYGKSDCLIWFEGRPDLAPASNQSSKQDKGLFVYQALADVAKQSQNNIAGKLTRKGVPFRSFCIVNVVALKADLNLVMELVSDPKVKRIIPDPWIKNQLPEANHQALYRGGESIEWGIQLINAVDAWDMGYRGQGVVIGGQDTGYDWKHPALINSYRGFLINGDSSHAYNWHDAITEISPLHMDPNPDPSLNDCGLGLNYPCDDHNHGTHTMGTMTGLDGENEIGVAPEAQWIGCRNMERGYGKPSTYIECFEFFLAPTNLESESPNPELAPDIINNSWSCPEMEGCNSNNWAVMEEAVNNLRQAGILVVVSAGNSGRNGCSTVSTPSAMFESSFTVGAVASNDTIAGFSSRGLVTVDGSNRMKPNVVAPGVGVRSAVRGNSYASFSGTSMAGPHTAGAAALLLSAVPEIRGNVNLIEDLLENTAIPKMSSDTCSGIPGTTIPNPIYGFGRIDIKAAIEQAKIVVNAPESLRSREELTMIPNPASGFVSIIGLDHQKLPGILKLHDASGRLVKQVTVRESLPLIDIRDIQNGIYIYTYNNKDYYSSGKISVF